MNSEDIEVGEVADIGGHNGRRFYARTWRWLKDRSTIITFFFFNIILTTADVGTDVWTAFQLIRLAILFFALTCVHFSKLMHHIVS